LAAHVVSQPSPISAQNHAAVGGCDGGGGDGGTPGGGDGGGGDGGGAGGGVGGSDGGGGDGGATRQQACVVIVDSMTK